MGFFGKLKVSEIEITCFIGVTRKNVKLYNILKSNKYFLFEEFGGWELTIDFLKLKGKKEKYFNIIFFVFTFSLPFSRIRREQTLSSPISARIRNII